MRKRFLIFLMLPLLLFSEGKVFYSQSNESVIPPWLTGPLIAPTAHVVPLGHYNIEPYIFATAFTGTYSSEWDVVKFPTFWNSFLQIPTMIGLVSWLDVIITPTVNWNYSQHQAAWTVGDLLFGEGLHVLEHADLHAEHLVERAHPLRVAAREVVVDGHEVHAPAAQ